MPDEQRTFHIITEILAIPVGIFLINLGIRLKTSKFNKTALIVIGAGNLIIDGYLLTKWF